MEIVIWEPYKALCKHYHF